MGEMADEFIDNCYGYEDDLFDRLERGLHTMRDGSLIEISKMETSHLKNCIAYGGRNPNMYWDEAIPLFQEELEKRSATGG